MKRGKLDKVDGLDRYSLFNPYRESNKGIRSNASRLSSLCVRGQNVSP